MLYGTLPNLKAERRIPMIVKVHGRPGIERSNVTDERLLKLIATAVTEFQHALPILVPGGAGRHCLIVLLLKSILASLAPAAVGRSESLIQHVDVESSDSV